MKVTAIDVSFCQTGVDYNKVKADGIDTVIIRAGFGRETYQKMHSLKSIIGKQKPQD